MGVGSIRSKLGGVIKRIQVLMYGEIKKAQLRARWPVRQQGSERKKKRG